ncbi:MAG: hypothetical protein ACAI44_18250, partial [Candidatus Sericytochromatia bacterium]
MDPLMHLQMMKQAKKLTHTRDDQNQLRAAEAYGQALRLLRQYRAQPDAGLLKRVQEQLQQALTFRRTMPEPYACLAYLFLIHQDMPMALKYFKVAESLDPGSKEVEALRKMLVEASRPAKARAGFVAPPSAASVPPLAVEPAQPD